MMLGVDSDLNIVADDAGALTTGRHRPGVGIGQGNLLVGRDFHLPSHVLERLHLPAPACDLLLEAGCPCLGHTAVLPVAAVPFGPARTSSVLGKSVSVRVKFG